MRHLVRHLKLSQSNLSPTFPGRALLNLLQRGVKTLFSSSFKKNFYVFAQKVSRLSFSPVSYFSINSRERTRPLFSRRQCNVTAPDWGVGKKGKEKGEQQIQF
jgi:hypothetical protein